jgi:hypothetical protein
MDKSRNSDSWTNAGNIAIALGAAVWLVYAFMRFALGKDVSAISFLPLHLAGVIPGMLLRRRRALMRLVGRFRRNEGDGLARDRQRDRLK